MGKTLQYWHATLPGDLVLEMGKVLLLGANSFPFPRGHSGKNLKGFTQLIGGKLYTFFLAGQVLSRTMCKGNQIRPFPDSVYPLPYAIV